jgi:hypothetical protein
VPQTRVKMVDNALTNTTVNAHGKTLLKLRFGIFQFLKFHLFQVNALPDSLVNTARA